LRPEEISHPIRIWYCCGFDAIDWKF
jgi:hypothetical protein